MNKKFRFIVIIALLVVIIFCFVQFLSKNDLHNDNSSLDNEDRSSYLYYYNKPDITDENSEEDGDNIFFYGDK